MTNPMRDQGWVPATCVLTDLQAMLLLPAALDGEDTCEGCNHDRGVCGGRTKRPVTTTLGQGPEYREAIARRDGDDVKAIQNRRTNCSDCTWGGISRCLESRWNEPSPESAAVQDWWAAPIGPCPHIDARPGRRGVNLESM